jgi:phosphate transport system substrate-binding protein
MRMQLLAAAGLLFLLSACGQTTGQVEARNHILIAGSSTVYPFTQAVAERFHGGNSQFPTPVVQSTGTGAGFQLFCAGIGGNHPDVVGASRRITAAEMQACRIHGIDNLTELQIGVDGLAFVQSPAAPDMRLSRREIYEALSATPYGELNGAQSWRDINPSLPDIPILIYGPPSTSGTRDSLREMIMAPGCETNAEMQRLKERDEQLYTATCTSIRADGVYVESGEDDQRTAVQLIVNPGAIGIFGFSYLERQGGRLRGIPIEGVAPTEETIGSERYAGARPLYIYVKADQVDRVPGLRAFLAEYAGAIGPDGYLAQRGLVPAPEPVRTQTAQQASTLTPLNPSSLR